MHSRKTRINDGYYESQSRSFQSSKYNNNRYSNYYRDRDNSPKRVTEIHRSPETMGSPRDSRDRYHQNYRNKDRDRDYKKEKYPNDKRGRDRDLEYKTYSKKAKTRDRSSSDEDHKESDRVYDKNRYAADRDHSAIRRTSEKERRFGDWKEMISKASGKKYYYNERDKSSQWDKPEEWIEYEMSKEYPPPVRGYREKERDRKSREDRYGGRRNYNSNKHSRANSRSRWPQESYQASSSSAHHKRHEENADNMDISPDSTPTSEPSYASPSTANQHTNNSNINSNSLNHDDVMSSPNNGHAKHLINATNSNNNQLHHQISNASTSSIGSTINKLNSNSNKNSSTTTTTTASSSSPSIQSIHNYQTHHHRNRSTSPSNDMNSSSGNNLHNNVGHDTNNLHHNSSSLRNSPTYSVNTNAVSSAGLNNSVSRLELNNSSSNLIGDGPPTPEMDLNSGEHRRLDTTSGVSSLQSVLSASQTSNRLNLLTPSLAKFFRADLITHVTNWPSEILEKQAQKCAEEVYLLGDLECSKISAEIQCARSIVRVAEIAATIQTQRRLFLQEQIKSLDESQSQNSSTISY
ncbi:WW domain-containing adapter protein with coiled-coil homolog [Chironomus tepperi]|uniref:WW domain-containing adapter protein with coiled-coil homolog n=1 Tax=Chironomus tepperi TaxID=113505 RepID=UPI00391F481D